MQKANYEARHIANNRSEFAEVWSGWRFANRATNEVTQPLQILANFCSAEFRSV